MPVQDPATIPSDLLTGINCEDDEDGGNRVNGKIAPRIPMNDLNNEAFLLEIGITGEDVEEANLND